MKELDPLIHSQLRLAIMSLLATLDEADFMYLKEQTSATVGNLSIQIAKLSEAGYIEVDKSFNNKRPKTTCRMTDAGREAFGRYVQALKEYITPVNIVNTEESPTENLTNEGMVLC